MSLRVGFLGTPEVAVPALRALLDDPDIAVEVVVTNPDRPKGRSKRPVAPPVKAAAEQAGIPVWQPGRPREIIADLTGLDLDVCAVVAYGALLPKDVLDVPRLGFVNLHFSLLPRWRGAAPVQHALRAGDTVTGVTTFVLDEGMDTGPVIERLEVPIGPDESAGELLSRLSELGAPLLARSLHRLAAGDRPQPQPEEGVTIAPKIAPEDVQLDLTAPAVQLDALVRSADPVPGAHTTFRGERLKVFRVATVDAEALPEAGAKDAEHGTIVHVGKRGPVVAVGDGWLQLTALQPFGKQRIDGAAFVNGYRPMVGERLGEQAGDDT